MASVFSEVGFAPAGVMLSAYGFFDGTKGKGERAWEGGEEMTGKWQAVEQHNLALKDCKF